MAISLARLLKKRGRPWYRTPEGTRPTSPAAILRALQQTGSSRKSLDNNKSRAGAPMLPPDGRALVRRPRLPARRAGLDPDH